jgi:hypothetical protein
LVFKQTYHARIFRSVGAFFIRKMQNIQKAQLQSARARAERPRSDAVKA